MSDRDSEFYVLEEAILALRRLGHAQLDTIMDLVSGVSVEEYDGDDGDDDGEDHDDVAVGEVAELLARARRSAS